MHKLLLLSIIVSHNSAHSYSFVCLSVMKSILFLLIYKKYKSSEGISVQDITQTAFFISLMFTCHKAAEFDMFLN